MKNKVGKAKAEANSRTKPIDKEVYRLADGKDQLVGDRLDWEAFLETLDFKSRVILTLRFEFDFDCPDIGKVIGISHQRIHQIMADLFERYRTGKVLVPPGRGGKPMHKPQN